MLTLLKQARAYGLGCVLATQNPVDLDYKGLSNTGTWFLGRLQTERDKARVLDGLEGAAATTGAGFDRAQTEATLSGLSSRVFLLNNVHDDGPVLFHTRWAMSYLRGPLTRAQIKDLQGAAPAPAVAEDPKTAPAPAPEKPKAKSESSRPVVPPDIAQGHLDGVRPVPDGATLLYRPALVSSAQLHFANASRGIDVWSQKTVLAPLDGASAPADPWKGAAHRDGEMPSLSPEGEEDAAYAALPKGTAQVKRFRGWEKRLKSAVYRDHTLPLWYCKPMRAWSEPPETEGEFRTRLVELSREKRDLTIEKLRKRYTPKLARLEERRRRAEEKIGKEQAQVEAQKQSTWISAGTAVIGALFGRKALSTGTASRVGTTLRRGSRIAKEKEDVERAMADLAALEEKYRALEAEFEDEIDALEATPDAGSFEIDARPLRPRKGDIAIEPLRLVWTPWALGADGVATPLFEL